MPHPIDPETAAGIAVTYTSPSPGVVPIPSRVDVARGNVLTQWQFTDADRAAIAAGATLIVTVLTKDLAPQPISIELGPPRGSVKPLDARDAQPGGRP